MQRLLAALALFPLGVLAQDATDNTPLYGTWSWTGAENHCTEIFDFRPDGVAYVISGAERTENTYSLSAKPGPTGRKRLVMTATRYHAGKDCSGNTQDPTGKPAISYVLLLPGRAQMIVCNDENSEACFGPLFKVNP